MATNFGDRSCQLLLDQYRTVPIYKAGQLNQRYLLQTIHGNLRYCNYSTDRHSGYLPTQSPPASNATGSLSGNLCLQGLPFKRFLAATSLAIIWEATNSPT